MDQFPEKDAPQTPSEQQPEAEATRPTATDEAPPPEHGLTMETTSETSKGAPQDQEAAPEETRPAEQPVASTQPDRSEGEAAQQAEGPETEQAVAAEQEAEEPSRAGEQAEAETGETPTAEAAGEGTAATEAAAPTEVPEAVGVAAEARPKPRPARPEKPTGPRLAELHPGMVVEGTVTRIEKYGAFVNLGLVERRDGLIHISEMAPYRVRRVEDVIQVGSPVRARVVSVDMGRGRVALSLNDVDEGSVSEASAGPSEPTLTSMALAFQEAQNRRREEQESTGARGGEVGSRKKREQEELMRKLRATS